MERPWSASRVVGWRTAIGVRRTPTLRPRQRRPLTFAACPRMVRDCPGHLSGRRRIGPRISIRCNRIQAREGFLLWEAKEKLTEMLVEVLTPGELALVFVVVIDRLRCLIVV